jgi:hypothetical protein
VSQLAHVVVRGDILEMLKKNMMRMEWSFSPPLGLLQLLHAGRVLPVVHEWKKNTWMMMERWLRRLSLRANDVQQLHVRHSRPNELLSKNLTKASRHELQDLECMMMTMILQLHLRLLNNVLRRNHRDVVQRAPRIVAGTRQLLKSVPLQLPGQE